MKQITEMLKKVGVFYIATTDANGDPHVRPFGAVAEIDGMTCICTSNQKKCFKEMMRHSRVEISGMCGEMEWIRLTADVVELDSEEVIENFDSSDLVVDDESVELEEAVVETTEE